MKKILLFTLSAVFSLAAFAQVPFTAGNLVIYQVGDGAAALSTASTAAFLNEVTTSGGAVRQITLPTSGTDKITLAGTATSEGLMSRSQDGTALVIAGYDAAAGTAAVAATTSVAVKRVIGLVKFDGSLDLSTKLSDYASASNPRSAATADGSEFWAGSGVNGIRYATLGASTSTVISGGAPTNVRQVNVVNSSLYTSTASGTPGILQLGTGLPTTSSTYTTLISTGAGASPYGFVIHMASAVPANGDIVYIADDRAVASGGGVQKWTYNAGAWTLSGTLNMGTTGVRGLAVDFSGAFPVIYATTTEASANRLVSIIDDGASTVVTRATAPVNTAFRGVQFAPQTNVVGLRFVSFNGVDNSVGFGLKWTTANEENVAAFTVQKSTDGISFEDIASQAAVNNNSGAAYSYTYTGAKGTVYFRIKATELSGRTTYTNIIRTDIRTAEGLKLYPTVTGGNLTMEYGAAGNAGVLSIINNSGSEVFRKNIAAGTIRETVSVQQLAPGTYFVKYVTLKGDVQTTRFVKQ